MALCSSASIHAWSKRLTVRRDYNGPVLYGRKTAEPRTVFYLRRFRTAIRVD